MTSADSLAPPVTSGNGASPARAPFSPSHTTIGLRYLFLSFVAVAVGVFLSILIRMRVIWPGAHLPFSPASGMPQSQFEAVVAMHGALMLFFVLALAAQQGLGSFFLPLQIGAEEMAAPRLNALAFWGTCVSFLGVVGSFLVPGENASQMVWVASVCLFCLCAIATALNFCVTIVDFRAPGMKLLEMPLTVWSWFISAILILMTCSIELAAGVLLVIDRLAGTSFFYAPDSLFAAGFRDIFGNSTLTWTHLFWFFGDPFVYIVLLPAIGIVSHVLAIFCRKPFFAPRLAVLMICALGFAGFAIWGRHMFVSGLNPYATFSFAILALSIGVPAMVMTLLWLVTLWERRIERTTAMRFAVGFVALFVTGGISGLFLTLPALQIVMREPEYIAGHFHLILAMAAVFAMFAGFYFWFPRMFGRMLDERLGKIHFWLTFAGAYSIFLPLHFFGVSLLSSTAGPEGWLAALPGIAALVTGAAQLIFVYNFWKSAAAGHAATADPWSAGTLEWRRVQIPGPTRGNPQVTLATFAFGSALVFYMALSSAYLVRRAGAAPAAMSFSPSYAAWIAAAFLIAAAVAVAKAGASLQVRREAGEAHFSRWVGIASLAAALFLAAQGFAWRSVLVEGVVTNGNPAASYFLLFSGVHALLVLGGLVADWTATRARSIERKSSLAEALAIYWNFAAGIWLFLLALLALRVQAG
ncbi:MAG TPA: cbb3-type cytochrome c oxidase subunit I [Candidatus Acidoferrum sp.]|nr:cbb3-type cytochrome c oxidase subunit I [Candidatus Acidoferrum sp.]